GVAGAQVTLGALSTVTGATGYFVLQAATGTYTLRHYPPTGFGVFSNPDSFVVTVGPALTRSFADTARAGGTVHIHVFNDLNDNGTMDTGETGRGAVKIVLNGSQTVYTASTGDTSLFAQVGGYSLAC